MHLHHLAAGALLAGTAAAAAPATIHVERSWARASNANSAAYVTVHNGGRSADRLLGASSPAARQVSIHRTVMDGGVMRMRGAGAIAVAPGKKVEMKPGGLHVMLVGLKTPIRAGQKLPLTLRFERAGIVRADADVLPAGAAPAASHHHGH